MNERETDATFIIPPSPFLADERVFPFLGVLKVASNMEKEGYKVDVVDLSGVGNYKEVVDAYMQGKGKEVKTFGITATTPQFPHAVKINETIKENNPDAKVIFGGAHATMVGSARRLDQKKGVEHRGTRAFNQMVDTFDTSVVGDGEEAIFEAIKGEARVIEAGQKESAFFLQKGTLENYPFPNRELIDMSSYHYQIDGKDAQSMIAQLGCPFECGFCGGRNTPSFRMARSRSTESILEEVDVLVGKYNKDGIMFYDDELNINNDKLMELMDGLTKYQMDNKKDLRLRGFVKAELFTLDQAKAMHKAGFRIMLSGVESGDDGILATMRKHTTREINSAWVRNCHEAGLSAKALMSIGHPGESKETVANSLEWALANLQEGDDIDWTIITEYPGSPYFDQSTPHPTEGGVWVYEQPQTHGVLFSQDINFAEKAEYYKGVPGDYTSYVWTEHLSPQELVIQRDWVEKITRERLNLDPVRSVPVMQFERSMGSGRTDTLPNYILRTSK